MLDHDNPEANKKLIRDYTEQVFNKHDATAAAGFMSPDAQWHGGTLGAIQGAENIAGMLGGFFAALPDLVNTRRPGSLPERCTSMSIVTPAETIVHNVLYKACTAGCRSGRTGRS